MVTTESGAVVRRLWAAQGAGGVFLAGAYTQLMVPLQVSWGRGLGVAVPGWLNSLDAFLL